MVLPVRSLVASLFLALGALTAALIASSAGSGLSPAGPAVPREGSFVATPPGETDPSPEAEKPGESEASSLPDDDANEPSAASASPEPKPELTAAQAAQAERVRRTLASYRGLALGGTQNTATEIMDYCLAFGCDTEIYRGGSSGQKINGITYLCWNYPCAGYELLELSLGHVAARVGYGLQDHPSQLLAVLALSRVKPDYPMRVGEGEEDLRSVADLVEYEKLSCRSGADQSLKLIGLAHYVGDEPVWKNSLGEEWSIARIVEEELDQPVLTAPRGGTQRLLGLGFALARRQADGRPIDGPFLRARAFVDEYHDYALKLQNSDGSWGPRFLAARGGSRDLVEQLASTGHVLQWLVVSLPEDQLDDARVARSVDYLIGLLSNSRYRGGVASMSTREISAVMHALHALVVYDQRFLGPRTPGS